VSLPAGLADPLGEALAAGLASAGAVVAAGVLHAASATIKPRAMKNRLITRHLFE
jgi:hypothetical protein